MSVYLELTTLEGTPATECQPEDFEKLITGANLDEAEGYDQGPML